LNSEALTVYDAIVVGARCAGSPTAMLLARQGYRVLLIDRATFPSDTMSTHHIHRAGVARLARWGLLERLLATGGPRIKRWTFDLGPFALVGNPVAAGPIDFDVCPRRTKLDAMLVDAAAASGAEVRQGFPMRALLVEDGRVCGIVGQSSSGAPITERARIVIGADGRNSAVARAVHAPEYETRPSLTCGFYSYWQGVDLEGVELYPREGRAVIAEQTNDGLVYVASGWRRAAFNQVRDNVECHLAASVEACAPSLAERMRGAVRVAPFAGTADFRFFYRRPYGPGWALVGDAGYHRDAVTGQGISDALRDAELLAEAVHAGLNGRQELAPALADYERRRNAATRPMYEFTYDLARLEPPTPEHQQLFAALRGNQPQIERFLGTIAGTVGVAEFFDEANVARIMREALPAAA
jgi:flavin-dependent dehydrogenase